MRTTKYRGFRWVSQWGDVEIVRAGDGGWGWIGGNVWVKVEAETRIWIGIWDRFGIGLGQGKDISQTYGDCSRMLS